MAMAGNTGPPRKPDTERERVGESFRHDEQEQHRRGALGDDLGQLRLTREEHEVDGPVGERAKATASTPTRAPATTSARSPGLGRLIASSCARCLMPTTRPAIADRHDEAPGQVGKAHRVVGGQRRQGSELRMHPRQSPTPVNTSAPVPAATNPGSSARPIIAAGTAPLIATSSSSMNDAASGPPKAPRWRRMPRRA